MREQGKGIPCVAVGFVYSAIVLWYYGGLRFTVYFTRGCCGCNADGQGGL